MRELSTITTKPEPVQGHCGDRLVLHVEERGNAKHDTAKANQIRDKEEDVLVGLQSSSASSSECQVKGAHDNHTQFQEPIPPK